MTVSSAVAKSGPYTGADDFVFAYNFRVFADAEIQVTTVVIATGVEEILTLTTDYTVQDAGDPTGTVTLTVGTFPTGLPSTKKLVVSRDMGFLQEIDFENQGGFFPDTHEDGLDRLKMEVQQVKEEVDRSVKVDITGTITADDLLDDIDDSVAAAAASAAAAAASETAAGISETNADADATATAADAVITAADAAATAADAIATAADAVSTAADAAATAADEANTNADAIATAADAVSTAADAAATEADLDDFTDLYLGAKASDPALDNDGDALQDGALYWNTATQVLKTYNLSNTTWYATTTTAVEAVNPNLLINGSMNINQRGDDTGVANASYVLDRWKWFHTGAMVYDVAQQTTGVPDGSLYSQEMTITTGDASIAAGDFTIFSQLIEGYNAQVLKLGTAGAEAMTLSFKVKSPVTGIHCVALRNAANDRSYLAEYTVDSADTWETKAITLIGDTAGTWLIDENVGLSVAFSLAAGSTFQGTVDTWQAGNFLATSNQVNVMETATDVFEITQVKLETGSVATAFVPRKIEEALALCQRYYEAGPCDGYSGDVTDTNGYGTYTGFLVEKRVAPTIVLTAGADANFNMATLATNGITVGTVAVVVTADATGPAFYNASFTADAEL